MPTEGDAVASHRGNRFTTIPSDTLVRTPALSRRLEGSRREAVLLIHGFTGIVGEMEYLAGRLNEAGFTVSIPRLPGHGTNHQDFLAVGWRDWVRRCLDEYLELAAGHERVYVGGLSMGGLLALVVAATLRAPRIVLAAPALRASNRLIHLTPLVRLFVKSVSHGAASKTCESDPELQALELEYKNRFWIGPLAELRSLQRLATSLLPRVEAATLTIVSRSDRTVPASVAELIERRIASRERRRVVLEKSGHLVVDGVERERVADEVLAWFRR